MIVLGPVRCQKCRRFVTWNGWEWQDLRGYRHSCARKLNGKSRDE